MDVKWILIFLINFKMRFRENQFYKGNARPCFTKIKIVTDRVDGI